jgi:hypothetical protein
MNVQLPFANPSMTTLIESLRRIFAPVVSSNEGTPRILLQSPGTATTAPVLYALTISDAGVMTTTLVDGKTRV